MLPATRDAKLEKATVIKEVHATFSPEPGVDQWRPAQKTAIEGLFLAGDWTRTGWPSTMEGAVRSGYLAAEETLAEPRRAAEILAGGSAVRRTFEDLGEAGAGFSLVNESTRELIALVNASLPFYARCEEEDVRAMFQGMMGSIPPGGFHGAEV